MSTQTFPGLGGLTEMANIFGIRIPSIKQQRCQLPLKRGKELCFGMKIIKNTLMQSSWWVNLRTNTFIADAIYKQLTTLEHVLFGGFTHEPAIEVGS
jgi:adenosylmethionine-8-amino-7-oxononanoate aminotransferase